MQQIFIRKLKKFCKGVQGLFYILLAMAKPYNAYNMLKSSRPISAVYFSKPRKLGIRETTSSPSVAKKSNPKGLLDFLKEETFYKKFCPCIEKLQNLLETL